ncbi:MAG TPA: ABC-2 family transporter protein [Isosphaeraceae bacterium]|jgi:ABC-2 type transport system permease protein
MTPPDLATPIIKEPIPQEVPTPRPPGAAATLRKYSKIFRASLVERMTYRGDFLLATFLRFLPMLTTILLWNAIYAGARSRSGATALAGFRFPEMIAYLLLVNISRMFSSMPGLAGGIARDIREGTIKRYLIQPVDLIGYLAAYRVAHKATYIVSSALPYAVLFFLCRGFFVGLVPTDPVTWLAYAVSLVLAFLVGFFFEASVGMVGFWFLEVTSLLYIVMTLNFFISGHMLPLDLLPRPWSDLLKLLPFQYMAYFPAVVFLGKVTGRDLALGLLGELAWALAFIALARWLYRRGLRRYSAFGG